MAKRPDNTARPQPVDWRAAAADCAAATRLPVADMDALAADLERLAGAWGFYKALSKAPSRRAIATEIADIRTKASRLISAIRSASAATLDELGELGFPPATMLETADTLAGLVAVTKGLTRTRVAAGWWHNDGGPPPIEWIYGVELPALFARHFRRRFSPMIGRDGAGGPGIRFVQAAAVAIGEPRPNHFSVRSAWATARKRPGE